MSGSSYGDAKTGVTSDMFPFGAFELVRKNDSVFSSVFGYFPASGLNLTVRGQADIANGEYVTGDYFRGLGVAPAAGRLLLADDDRAGAPAVAVVSRAFSERRFGGPAEAAGQSILINNVPFTVVGVTPPEFFGVDPGATPDVLSSDARGPVAAALRSGAGLLRRSELLLDRDDGAVAPRSQPRQAQSALAEPFHRWVDSTAGNDRERTNLPALVVKDGARGLDVLRRRYSKPLYILMTLVGLILAIACANIANLLLARAAARRREIALRLSVGAGRFRVVRQLVTESIVLASLGGMLGVGFAIWGIRLLTLLLANGRANFTLRAELNWHVLGAAAALSLLTGVVFGLAPAIQATGGDVMPALKEIRTSRPHSRFRLSLSHVLVVSQIALSLLMLVAAGLFVRTLGNLESVELAFNRENVLLFRLNARQAEHRDAEIAAFYRRPAEAVRLDSGSPQREPVEPAADRGRLDVSHHPDFRRRGERRPRSAGGSGVLHDDADSVAAGAGDRGTGWARFAGRGGGQRAVCQGELRQPESDWAAPDHRVCPGRFGDRRGVEGRPLRLPEPGRSADGVFPVSSVRGSRPRDLRGADGGRSRCDTLGRSAKSCTRRTPRVPVAEVRTQAAQIDRTISQEITFARLCTAFAILALAIACVGLYGTMTYNVARRTGEIGIRMALGAQRGAVVWMVLREVLLLAAVGLAISVPAALGTSKVVESFLFGMKPNDPAAMAIAVAILLAAALVAGYVPARKAARIDPAIALRHE